MTVRFDDLSRLLDHGYDSVIDVRAPAEFAEDHLPGARNLPVLNDAERARVGTIYKQQSPFAARKIGAAMVFRNAAAHVEGPLSHHDGGWRPLVYCWRGGQRSGSFAWMLREIGWRADIVDGGYRTYRRLVHAMLYDTVLPHQLVQLGGYTGTAKTALLALAAERGAQVLDLETMACHRGSLLGDMPGGQPSQKMFETRLAQALAGFDRTRPVLVEAESNKIGTRIIPPSLWGAMKAAPWIEIRAPLAARAAYLAQTYDDILSDGDRLCTRLAPLRQHRGHALVDHWNSLISAGDRIGLCRSLAADHYDPSYDKSMQSVAPSVQQAVLETDSLDPKALRSLADRIVDILAAATPPNIPR